MHLNRNGIPILRTYAKSHKPTRSHAQEKAIRRKIGLATRLMVWERDERECRYCHEPVSLAEMTVDHLVPLCRGGQNEIMNYGCACQNCNRLKAAMTEDEFNSALWVCGQGERGKPTHEATSQEN